MPPCCAMAMASRDSVTVSIAALSSGTLTPDVAGEPRCRRRPRSAAPSSAAAPAARRRTSAPWSGRSKSARSFRTSVRVSIHPQNQKGSKRRCALYIARSPMPGAVHGARSTCSRPVALLVFLSAAARARIVAADLRLVALHLPDRRRRRRCAPGAAARPIGVGGRAARGSRRTAMAAALLTARSASSAADAAAPADAPAPAARPRLRRCTGVSRHR